MKPVIDVEDDHEVLAWSLALNVSPDRLRDLVAHNGNDPLAVREALKRPMGDPDH